MGLLDELKKLISVIDRNSPIGKRDYAMILLACVLGLRISDIKGLRFSNFDWNNGNGSGTGNVFSFATNVAPIYPVYLRDGRGNIMIDENGYVYAFLPASEGCETVPTLGLIAHMDTAPDFSGAGKFLIKISSQSRRTGAETARWSCNQSYSQSCN